MKTRAALVFTVVVLALFLSSPSWTNADIVAIDDDFESGSLDGWTASAGIAIVDGVPGANGKVVRVQGSGESNLIKSVSTLHDMVIAELRVMTDATDKEKRIHFSNDDAVAGLKHYVYLRFTPEGRLTAVTQSSGEIEVLNSVVPGQWYSLKVEINVKSGKYHVYVDGVLRALTVARYSANATQINYMNVKSRDGGALFVDDVKLYEVVPDPVSPLAVIPTFEAAGIYLPWENGDAQVAVYYRKQGDTTWQPALPPFYSKDGKEFRGSIVNLEERTIYEVKAEITENETLIDTLTASFTTWSSDVPIAQTIPVSQLYNGGQLLIQGMQGSEDGWIKIIGDGTVIDAGTAYDTALQISNSKYLILEKMNVRGGRINGISIDQSESVRVINSEVSGWGRTGEFDPNRGLYVDESGVPINYDSGIKVWNSSKVVIERNYLHDPRGQTNSWDGPTWTDVHPNGPNAMYVRGGSGYGQIVVRYNDFIGSEDHRWNDAVEGGSNGSYNGGFYRDSDIYGNMFAFGNDDGIELDGGQMNVRFYHNKIEGFYSGISTAPNILGPSYIFRNLVVNLGDSNNKFSSFIKAGGGTTYSHGTQYVFHNTVFTRGQGINGIGYGSDANRRLYYSQSRNNVIVNTRYLRDFSIRDDFQPEENDFDYDVLGNYSYPNGAAQVRIADGQESHGMFGLPRFRNIVNGDFRLAAGSLGIDGGIPIPNLTGAYAGTAPDAGAWELGSSSFLPIRPIALTADKYQINLRGAEPQTVTITAGQLEQESIPFRIRKNEANDWLAVSVESGVIAANSTLTFTVQANTELLRRELEKGVILVRLENGYSLPITVYVDNTPPVTVPEIQGNRVNPETDPIAVYNSDVTVSLFASNEGLSYIEYEYSLDGGSVWLPYQGLLQFTEDGIFTLMYRATDASGNAESAQTLQFIIDFEAETDPITAETLARWTGLFLEDTGRRVITALPTR
jgi:hypothetical protein